MRLRLGGLGVLGALDAHRLARALARARVGRRALSAHRQPAAMTNAAIAIDRLQALEIGLHFAAKIAFDWQLARLNRVDDFRELLRRQLVRTDVSVHSGLLENAAGGRRTDAINVGQRRFDAFFAGNFNTKETGHGGISDCGF